LSDLLIREGEPVAIWRESSVSASRFELTASMSSKRIIQRLGSLANWLFRMASSMVEKPRI